MTQRAEYPDSRVLCMAMDVSKKTWALAFGTEGNVKVIHTTIPRGDEGLLRARIKSARRRLRLPDDCRVVSCHEAGRDGFSIHRWLAEIGIENVMVHAASLKVDQRARRAKTDKLDARQLLKDLIRHVRGDVDVWKVVRVPTIEQEDNRIPHRELERMKKERTQHQVRIQSLLVGQGSYINSPRRFLKSIAAGCRWDGRALPPNLQKEIERERERFALVDRQIADIERERARQMEDASTKELKAVQKLASLRGIGVDSAWLLVMEFFAWRKFQNRGELAGAVGLAGTPFSSGSMAREQGIGKEGNRRVRTRMIELAWKWIQHQPGSDLSQWFGRRFGSPGRMRRVGIVAVARKLLVALWHFLEHDQVPKDALLKNQILVTR